MTSRVRMMTFLLLVGVSLRPPIVFGLMKRFSTHANGFRHHDDVGRHRRHNNYQQHYRFLPHYLQAATPRSNTHALSLLRPKLEERRHSGCPTACHSSGVPLRMVARGGGGENRASDRENPFTSWRDAASSWGRFIDKNFFLLGMLAAVALSCAFPSLGRDGGLLRPELLLGNFGVALIFLLSGFSLELAQLTKAASSWTLNLLILAVTFAVWPFIIGIPLTKLLAWGLPSVFPLPLREGIMITTALPTTVNMCVILTAACGGAVAPALWNAVLSNLAGIFVTPAILFATMGTNMQLPFLGMVAKLSQKVLLPVVVGQVLRLTALQRLARPYAKTLKRLQEVILLGILWNAFCNAWSQSLGISAVQGVGMLTLIPLLHALALAGTFSFFSLPRWNFSRGEAVAAMFCSSHKTLAFGLPLIHTLFAGQPHLALYCAPIIVIHPMQLLIGTFLVPRLQAHIEANQLGQP